MLNDFYYTEKKDLHFIRPLEILKENTEVKALIGKNPRTIYAIAGLVILQSGLTFLLRNSPWWLVLLVAYFVGAFIVHSLFALVHECSHNLLFQKKNYNTLAGILANIAMFFPTSVMFQRYHLKHHAHQGIFERDADLPSRWEAKLIKNSILGKAVWLMFYPIFQAFRLSRIKEVKPFDKWIVLNWIAVFGVDVCAFIFLGHIAFIYLLCSFFFSVGLHPLGARWIQEHYLTSDEVQETHSYYGPLNSISFNIGYHNEHHDFPSVPWNKLPKIHKAGEKWYKNIGYHNSWTLLFFRFLFDKRISIFSRMIREKPEKSINT